MKRIFLFSAIALLLSLMEGCEKEEKKAPKYEAKGYVLGKTEVCMGNGLYIEVTEPKEIGKEGVFNLLKFPKFQSTYNNAIRVPFFDKVNLPVEAMEVGTSLHFEYRKYNPNKDFHYFSHKQICTDNHIPPTANTYIITKIISYKKPKRTNKELLGTWKCIGFGNIETGKIKPIEPQNCEKCFTLNFKPNGSLIAYSTFQLENPKYSIYDDYLTISFLYTFIGEEGDGNDFRQILSFNKKQYKIKNNQLFIYYSKNKYLLFNRKNK